MLRTLLFVVALIAAFPAVSCASDPQWVQYSSLGNAAFNQMKYDEAERYLLGALQGLQNTPGPSNPHQTEMLFNSSRSLAESFYLKRQYDRAAFVLKWLTAVEPRVLGADSEQELMALELQYNVLKSSGKQSEAGQAKAKARAVRAHLGTRTRIPTSIVD